MKPALGLFLVLTAICHGNEAGRVASLFGEVTSQDRPLYEGEPVHEGDTIRTQKKSGAKFLMSDASVLEIRESSTLQIKKYSATAGESEIDLDEGAIRALISKRSAKTKGKFNFRTKWGVMAITGTHLVLDARSTQLMTAVLEGSVALLLPGPTGTPDWVKLGTREKLSLGDPSGGYMAPRIETLSPADAARIEKEFTSSNEMFSTEGDDTTAEQESAKKNRVQATKKLKGLPRMEERVELLVQELFNRLLARNSRLFTSLITKSKFRSASVVNVGLPEFDGPAATAGSGVGLSTDSDDFTIHVGLK